MRAIVVFFGITRSLRFTCDSINTNIIEPLHAAGFSVRLIGHFNLPQRINNPRSGESNVAVESDEWRLLSFDSITVEPQIETSIAGPLSIALGYPDCFGDGYRSVRNICYQLFSLARLRTLMVEQTTSPGDVILVLRPDLLYVDPLDPMGDLGPILDGRVDLIVPGWQSWGGVNDRFAFATRTAVDLYMGRLHTLREACQAIGGLHPELLLRYVLERSGLRIGMTELRALRIRADGSIAHNDLVMMESAVTAHPVVR